MRMPICGIHTSLCGKAEEFLSSSPVSEGVWQIAVVCRVATFYCFMVVPTQLGTFFDQFNKNIHNTNVTQVA